MIVLISLIPVVIVVATKLYACDCSNGKLRREKFTSLFFYRTASGSADSVTADFVCDCTQRRHSKLAL